MTPRDRVRVRHMIEAAQTLAGFVDGRNRVDLDTDIVLQFAIIRAIEIFGEAASKLTAEMRSHVKELPWQAITGMRNRLIHAYFDIDLDMVWIAATEEIPMLLPALTALAAHESFSLKPATDDDEI